MKKGFCQRKVNYFNIITVTDKGQIAIPSSLRNNCKIKRGDKLVAVKRKNGDGINLLKADLLGDFLNKASKD